MGAGLINNVEFNSAQPYYRKMGREESGKCPFPIDHWDLLTLLTIYHIFIHIYVARYFIYVKYPSTQRFPPQYPGDFAAMRSNTSLGFTKNVFMEYFLSLIIKRCIRGVMVLPNRKQYITYEFNAYSSLCDLHGGNVSHPLLSTMVISQHISPCNMQVVWFV